MNGFSKVSRTIYLIWTLIHGGFFLASKEKASKSAIREFWPFQDYSNLRYDYDFTELIFYVIIIPLFIIFIKNNFLSGD